MIDLSPTPSVQPGEVLRSCIAGVRVRRGPDWSWGDQDGGGLGTTRADPDPGWVKVTWDNGGTNSYRVGRGGHYDLIVAQASSPSSQRNITVGSRVRFTEDSRNVDFAECPGTDLSFSVGDTCTVHEVRGDWFIPTRWRNLWAPLRAVELLETSDAMATPMVRPGEVLRSAEVGIRVRRGPDWEWHDQDGGGLGTTVEGSDRDGWVFVKWDAHGREYNYRVERSYDLIVDQSSFLSSAEVGVRVRAAPGWEWGDQDGGGLGTTVEASGPGWVRVRWDHGNTNGYQVGANDTYDLIIAQAPSAQPGEVLRSAQAGVRVRRGPGWSYSDQDGGAGGLGITTGEGRLGVRVRWDWDHGSSEGRYSYRIGPHRFDLIVVGVPGREQADAAEQAPSHTTTSAEPDGGYDEQWLDVAEAASMQCPICMCVARNAMAHDCGNLFCEICWIRWMAEDNPTCPVCRELGEGIVRAPRDRRKISNLMIRCQGCKESIRLADKEKHVSQCPKLVPRSEGEIGQQELSEQRMTSGCGGLAADQVALVLRGETHEAVDLTRTKSILEPTMGWVDSSDAFLLRAQQEQRLLLFHMVDSVNGVGQEIAVKPGEQEENTQYFLWKDLDPDEHDAIIARCKERLRMEGVELFDDWLIRARRLPHVELILEGPVRMALVPSCSYLVRRVRDNLPSERVHFFELRELGNPELNALCRTVSSGIWKKSGAGGTRETALAEKAQQWCLKDTDANHPNPPRRAKEMPSLSVRTQSRNLSGIRIPSFDEAMQEILSYGIEVAHRSCMNEKAPQRQMIVPMRGPDWQWGNQDGRGPGTTEADPEQSAGWVTVRWEDGSTNSYRVGAEGGYDLVIDSSSPLSASPSAPREVLRTAEAGVRVMRGPDWEWGEQDGGGFGTTETDPSQIEGWVTVRWDHDGSTNSYRVGRDGMHDLIVAEGHRGLGAEGEATVEAFAEPEPDEGHDEQWLDVEEATSMQCPICMCVPRDALVHECGNLFCQICWSRWIAKNSKCPVCREDGSSIVKAFRDQRKILNLMIRCPLGCEETFRLGDKEVHVSQCPKRKERCSQCGEEILSEIISFHQKDCCLRAVGVSG
ncbi:E3 ubiquitin-protein ligase MIB1 (DAPK-interacting protein 1) (DIP-1) (Mind bomb homolog 1) (RING-type E3 ubiquitin transferase MIB1) [Durusdinium trenchii]|uniref:E3 ubiquitin-protein ligase MIB1 (DAPK-interacting protein 1) (DIP-1) (Mind bomb homolog 1) (RING-type E3 ubiquitin transferase MIB1) n=1 Tax=Durusdinium trenchii TaxID=1381693 RepID=A0ABP0P9N9_9DINO